MSCDKTKYTLTTQNTCYDCVNDYRKNKELCPKTHEYIIKKVTNSKRTESLVIDISFDKSDKILTTIKKIKDWSKLFKTTIEGLKEGTDYTGKLLLEKNSLLFVCDFLADGPETTLTIETVSNFVSKEGEVQSGVSRLL